MKKNCKIDKRDIRMERENWNRYLYQEILTTFLKGFEHCRSKRSLKDEAENFQDGISNGV